MSRGIVYFVGAGPGDPKLITVKGLEAIRKADVLVYDRLTSPQLLNEAREDAERIYVGKLPDRHTVPQEEINRLLVRLAREGKVVVRLKGGDPAVFGRVGEEAEALASHHIPFEIIPGITSAIAVPTYAGIPVTHREYSSSFAVVTGHENPKKTHSSIHWERLATSADTLIFLMGVANLPYIVEQLVRCGRPPSTPVALVRWGTRPEQRTLVGTLETIVEQVRATGFSPPAVIIVGEVVRLREQLAWFEKKPLFGHRVLVTRDRGQASVLSSRIEELGGEAVEFPVIRIRPVENAGPLDQALDELERFDWAVFTSVNAVNHFFHRLRQRKMDIRQLRAQIAAVGPKTREALEDKGLQVQVFPAAFHAEGLLDELLKQIRPGMRLLFPKSEIARDVLPQRLAQHGVEVMAVDVYANEPVMDRVEELVSLLEEGAIHVITFTSSSTVRNFFQALSGHDVHRLLSAVKVASIGPHTSATCRQLGIEVAVEARQSSIDGLVDALIAMAQQQHQRGEDFV